MLQPLVEGTNIPITRAAINKAAFAMRTILLVLAEVDGGCI